MRIYDTTLQMVTDVMAVIRLIERVDRDLGRQLRRSCTSVPLNLAEGLHSRGRNQNARFHDAMASARETMAGLQVSVAAGYIAATATHDVLDRLDHIVATLWKLIHR